MNAWGIRTFGVLAVAATLTLSACGSGSEPSPVYSGDVGANDVLQGELGNGTASGDLSTPGATPSVTGSATASATPGATPANPAGTPGTVPTGGPAPSPKPTPVKPVATTTPDSLNYTAPLIGGGEVDMRKFTGKPVVIYAWTSFCVTCREYMPDILKLNSKYNGKAAIVTAGLVATRANDLKDFVSANRMQPLANIDDRSGALVRRYRNVQQSTWVLIDPMGKVTTTGSMDPAQVDAWIAKQL